MRQPGAPHAARVSACKELLDRGWGQAKQIIEAKVATAGTLSDDELADIIARSREGAAEAPPHPSQLN